MVFGRKKKPERRLEETREERVVHPLYVKVSEQTGVTEGRLLVIENRSSSPLMNVTLKLDPGTSDLGETITYPLMKPNEKKERSFKSEVKAFKHELLLEPPKALAPGDELEFSIIVASEIPAEGRVEIPIRGASSIHATPSAGEIEEADGVIRTFDVQGEARIDVVASPDGSVDPRRIGAYRVELTSNSSMSGIKILEVKAYAQINVSIEKESLGGNERKVIANVENPNEFHVELEGKVIVKGEEEVEEEISGLLAPGESKSVVLSVKSIDEPAVSYDIRGIAGGYVEYESIYTAEYEGVEIPLLQGELSVEAVALHDEILKKVLTEKEIPSVGESLVALRVRFTSTGHAPVELVERTTNIDPNIGELKQVKTRRKIEVSGNVRRIELKKPLKNSESIYVEEIYVVRPTGDETRVNFEVLLTAKSGEATIQREASDYIEVRMLRRSVSMNVTQSFEGEYIVYRVQLLNTGQMPAVGVTLIAEIPESDFEVYVEPKEDEKKKNMWKRVFDVIEPGEEKVVKIRVRPISEGASFDKIRIYQG